MELPELSVRARAVIVRDGNVLMDRTHHDDRPAFYWLPGGGIEPGETSIECLKRELVEEAAVDINVGRLLYVSENLFVESGEYRHEVILYRLCEIVGGPHGRPSDPRMHEWHVPGEQPGRLLPPDVAEALAHDVRDGFVRPVLHLVTDERPAGAQRAG